MKKIVLLSIIVLVCAANVFAQSAPRQSAGSDLDPQFKAVWEALVKSSSIWPRIDDQMMKTRVVAMYIEIFKRNGIKITNPPMYYVQRLDEIYGENPVLFNNPFNVVLQTVAIIDYDFDNRQDKDFLAKQVLGEQGFIANKKRLGLMQ